MHRVPRRSDQVAEASRALGCSASEVATILSGFGKTVGAPWREGHKQVAAAALSILADRGELRG